MADFISSELQSYLDTLIPERDNTLQEMEAYAAQNNFPIIGPQVGRFLSQIAHIHKPEKIFEMGSGFGYSAYWFAQGAPDSTIILTDHKQENLDRARKWMNQGKVSARLEFRKGNAVELLKESQDLYDIILIDIDKQDYPEAFRLALEKVPEGGIILIDNLIWHGRVLNQEVRDSSTENVREVNRMLFETPGILSTIVPIRDGLGFITRM